MSIQSLLTLTLPDPGTYLLAAWAVYRVSSMLFDEDGPFHLFKNWRLWLWKIVNDTTTTAKASPYLWVAEGFSCFYCLSFWVSLLLSVCIVQRLDLGLVVVWLSLAGIVQIYRRHEDRENTRINVAKYAATKGS